jgi:hypothetical protein
MTTSTTFADIREFVTVIPEHGTVEHLEKEIVVDKYVELASSSSATVAKMIQRTCISNYHANV